MRVVVNRQPTNGPRTGVGHHTAELLHALQTQAQDDEIHVYPTGAIWRFYGRFAGSSASGAAATSSGSWRRIVSGPLAQAGKHAWQLLQDHHFQAVCRRARYDLYHETNMLVMPCDVPTIATLHDLSAIVHPEWHPADRVKQYQRQLERSLKQPRHFLTVSDQVRQEIIGVLGIAPDKVTRIYNGVRRGLRPLPADEVAKGLMALGLPPSYLLHVGTLEPRKNLEMLVRAYCGLPDAVRSRCPLLLVGKWGWNTTRLAAYLDGEARHRQVIHLGYLAEEHLPLLYNGARALVFPSLYEGFGLPPAEMLACGGAVLASTAGAVTEVVGPCAQLLDAHDEPGWREAMRRVIADDAWRDQLRRGGRERVASLTWERCADQTLRTYHKVLNF